MALYKVQILAHNLTAHKILKNEVNLILPKFHKEWRNKRGIFGAIISGFLGLAFEGISSFLHHKRCNTLQKAVKAMSITMDTQRNKLMHLENSLIMYGVYNVETLSKLVKTMQILHSRQSLVEQLFAGQQVTAYQIYSKMQDDHSVQHYITNLLLYLHTIKEKYIAVYNEFITQLQIYTKAVRILAKGCLPISLVMPYKLQEILNTVKETLTKSNPDYDIVTKRLHLYYDMKLVTFRIDKDRNLIIQFPIFVQPYTQQPLILYQLETVPMPIIDEKLSAHSYTELQIKKPYITLNSETYINIQHQELATCKQIGNEFYCEGLFVVSHKTIHSCESAIYFDLNTEIIKQNSDFLFYYNKTDITPAVLDGGYEIILANWPTNKHIICSINNDIPIEIMSHPYVLVNRSVLCNCRIEAENNYLLESLAACHDSESKLVMYFTVNIAFTNYLDEFNLTEEESIPIITNKSTLEITLPVFLNKSKFNKSLLSALLMLKEYIAQYKLDKEIFDLKERHDIDELENEFTNQNFFNSKIVKIFKFMVAIISIIATVITIYAICKHNKLRALVTSLALQQVKEVKAQGMENTDYNCKCTPQLYIILTLSIAMIGLIMFAILQLRRIKLCRRQLFSNIVKIMLFYIRCTILCSSKVMQDIR